MIRNLPNGKSAFSDNITYECLRYGGEILLTYLTRLFNNILEYNKVPLAFKIVITITLHKGNGKSKSDPNNYRAISLLPVISKIFEKVILTRIEDKTTLQSQLHPLQHGLQKGKSCKMTSFLYQDAVNYTYERNQVIYSCFMDAMKAFDKT